MADNEQKPLSPMEWVLARWKSIRQIRFNSIRARGMLIGVGVVLLVVILAVTTFTLSMRSYYLSSMRSSLQSKAENNLDYFRSVVEDSPEAWTANARSMAENFPQRESLELQYLNTDGRVEISSTGITSGSIPGSNDVSSALASGRVSWWKGRSATGEHILAVSAPLVREGGASVGVLRYVTSLKLVNQAVNRLLLAAILVGLLVITLVVLSNLYFLRTITVPIRSLTAMSKRIAEGSYGARVEKQHDDEIGELTDTINDMSEKLSRTERMQTEFISSVSHELRTPLTAITGWSETMAFDSAIEGDSRRGLEIISREAARLTKMVEELLEFTRIQDGRFTLHVSTVDLAALVEDSLYTYNELFRKENITVNYDPPEIDIPEIPGDPERLAQVFLNILDNACKYGKRGGKIDVSLGVGEENLSVAVRDHGPGVPPDELPMIKKKFYKGSSKERGSGIGLAVCEEIVSRHNGKLVISNAEGGGLQVTVILPRKA